MELITRVPQTFRCAASTAGPEPASLREALGTKSGAAAFSDLAHPICAAWALPSPDRRQLVLETLVNVKREREGSRGKKSLLPHSFPSLPQWSVGNLLCLMSKCRLLWRQKRQWDDEASCHGRPRDPTDVCTAWQGRLLGRKERLSPSIRVISPCICAEFYCFKTLLH